MRSRATLNSFLNKVVLIESSIGRHICQTCVVYSTDDDSQFKDHFLKNHSEVEQINCIYCSIFIDSENYVGHVNRHFNDSKKSTSLCQRCKMLIDIQNMTSITHHLEIQHTSDEVFCPMCDQVFDNLENLDAHLGESVRMLYHCSVSDCNVKTNLKDEMNDHLTISGHQKESVRTEVIATCFNFQSDIEHNDLKPDSSFSPNLKLISGHQNESVRTEVNAPYFNEQSDIERNDLRHSSSSSSNLKLRRNKPPISKKPTNSDNESLSPVKRRKLTKMYEKDFEIDETFNYNYSELAILEIFAKKSEKFLDSLRQKLNKFKSIAVGYASIAGVRYQVCTECNYKSRHNSRDMKKHVLATHCGLGIDLFSDCLKVITTGNGDQYASNQYVRRYESIDNIEETLRLTINEHISNYGDQSEILARLEGLRNLEIGVKTTPGGRRLFVCMRCFYRTAHNIRDVKNHILSMHFGIDRVSLSLAVRLTTVVKDQPPTVTNDQGHCSKLPLVTKVESKVAGDSENRTALPLVPQSDCEIISDHVVGGVDNRSLQPFVSQTGCQTTRDLGDRPRPPSVAKVESKVIGDRPRLPLVVKTDSGHQGNRLSSYSEAKFKSVFAGKPLFVVIDLRLKLDRLSGMRGSVGKDGEGICGECGWRGGGLTGHLLKVHCQVDRHLVEDCLAVIEGAPDDRL